MPSALKTWPLVASPTGTEIGEPVSVTDVPRTRPSVGCIETARTMLSPMCCSTSSVSVSVSSPSVRSTWRALWISGISSGANSTSTTGPMMRTTRPVPPVDLPVGASSVAVMWLSPSGGRRDGEVGKCESQVCWSGAPCRSPRPGRGGRVGAADDLADLLGDLGRAGGVGLARQLADQLLGVVGRRLHRATPCRRLGGGGLEQRGEDPALDVAGEQRVENRL